MVINQNTTVVAAEDLSVAYIDDEAVLLDIQSGNYFGLNPVGVRIMNLIVQPRLVREICEALSQEYDVAPGQLESDVLVFLESMAAHELVEIKDGVIA
jgi:hypothetical protein